MLKKILPLFLLIFLLGAGCNSEPQSLTTEKIKQALNLTANQLGWRGSILEKGPTEKNYHGKSFIFFGEHREVGLDAVQNKIEIIELPTKGHADWAYHQDDCFKGDGTPIKIAGNTACCLNNIFEGSSKVVMKKEHYIFRAENYFNSDCQAGEYLKNFWKNFK